MAIAKYLQLERSRRLNVTHTEEATTHHQCALFLSVSLSYTRPFIRSFVRSCIHANIHTEIQWCSIHRTPSTRLMITRKTFVYKAVDTYPLVSHSISSSASELITENQKKNSSKWNTSSVLHSCSPWPLLPQPATKPTLKPPSSKITQTSIHKETSNTRKFYTHTHQVLYQVHNSHNSDALLVSIDRIITTIQKFQLEYSEAILLLLFLLFYPLIQLLKCWKLIFIAVLPKSTNDLLLICVLFFWVCLCHLCASIKWN